MSEGGKMKLRKSIKRPEQIVIEYFESYKQDLSRIRSLERHPVGAGFTVSALSQDDQLQDLHKQLRKLPTYMYLSKHEQKLELVAHAYLTRYPNGTHSQREEVKGVHTVDDDDEDMINDLVRRIGKVIKSRTGQTSGYESVLERIGELQELQEKKEYVDYQLDLLDEKNPPFGKYFRLRYIEGKTIEKAAKELEISERTIGIRKDKAIADFIYLAGLA